MARTPPPALVGYLRPYDPPIRALALKTRAYVIAQLAPCHEFVFHAGYTIAMGFGSTARVSDAIVYVGVYRKHVNIGFWEGASLDDPGGLLRGEGKQMRHVQVHTKADLANPALAELVQRARANADPPMALRNPRGAVSTVVKKPAVKRPQPRLTQSR